MAILFSHVTMESDYGIGEFFACGFPNDEDDLDGCIAYEEYLTEVSDDDIIDVHVEAYLYGDGETVRATPEELAYMIQRLEHDPLFLRDHCNNTADCDFEIHYKPDELFGEDFLEM
ncbi:MAG: hypothetical protein IJX14_07175 [Clostridia bacterium]|nr:hypothetical protein [Clostridia bacterium]